MSSSTDAVGVSVLSPKLLLSIYAFQKASKCWYDFPLPSLLVVFRDCYCFYLPTNLRQLIPPLFTTNCHWKCQGPQRTFAGWKDSNAREQTRRWKDRDATRIDGNRKKSEKGPAIPAYQCVLTARATHSPAPLALQLLATSKFETSSSVFLEERRNYLSLKSFRLSALFSECKPIWWIMVLAFSIRKHCSKSQNKKSYNERKFTVIFSHDYKCCGCRDC